MFHILLHQISGETSSKLRRMLKCVWPETAVSIRICLHRPFLSTNHNLEGETVVPQFDGHTKSNTGFYEDL